MAQNEFIVSRPKTRCGKLRSCLQPFKYLENFPLISEQATDSLKLQLFRKTVICAGIKSIIFLATWVTHNTWLDASERLRKIGAIHDYQVVTTLPEIIVCINVLKLSRLLFLLAYVKYP